MKIEKDFEVPAGEGETYDLLVDLKRVASCIPGGELGSPGDDGSHPATIAVRLGPMRMSYRGTVRLEERDETARRAVLFADVREQRGQGTAKAKMTMAVSAAGSGSRVATVTDVKLTGRAAQMGRGVVDDVAARLVADMAECIVARLARQKGGESATGGGAVDDRVSDAPERARPVSGIRLMLRVLWARLKRVSSRGRRGGEETDA